MKSMIIFPIFLLLLAFQLSLMPRLSVLGVFPNIILAAVLILAVKKNEISVLIWALLAGFLLDIFSSRPFGVYSISLSFIALAVIFFGKNLFKSTEFSGQAALMTLGCLMFSVLNIFLVKIFYWVGSGSDLDFWRSLWRVVPLEITLNFILALCLLFIYKKSYLRQ